MLKYLRQYRLALTLGGLLLLPILSIQSLRKAKEDYHFIDQVLIGLTAPAQVFVSVSLQKILIFLQNYLFLFRVAQDNRLLLEENKKLLNEIHKLKEAVQENSRLKKLMHLQSEVNIPGIAAQVISKNFVSDFRTIRINRGAASGIKKNMAVVNEQGVIGRIYDTTEHISDVGIIMNLVSAVDVIVQRSRASGVLEGLSEDLCELKYVVRTEDIQVDDVLITSGLGGIFPKGLKVGIVAQVNKKPYGTTQEVIVRPSVDFSRLEEVLVLFTKDLE